MVVKRAETHRITGIKYPISVLVPKHKIRLLGEMPMLMVHSGGRQGPGRVREQPVQSNANPSGRQGPGCVPLHCFSGVSLS